MVFIHILLLLLLFLLLILLYSIVRAAPATAVCKSNSLCLVRLTCSSCTSSASTCCETSRWAISFFLFYYILNILLFLLFYCVFVFTLLLLLLVPLQISTKVSIPLEDLDIAEFTQSSPESSAGVSLQDTLYDLQGLVSHIGTLHGVSGLNLYKMLM